MGPMVSRADLIRISKKESPLKLTVVNRLIILLNKIFNVTNEGIN